jgi:hypothetical protein
MAEAMPWAPRILADDDQVIPDEPIPDPASAIVTDNAAQTAAAAQVHPGEPDPVLSDRDLGGAATEPPVAGLADAGNSLATSAPSTEPGPASTSAASGNGGKLDTRWHEILATFVDDPRSSVELAAGLTGDRAEALVRSVRERQHSLLSTWQGDDAGTEQLRITLQQYRAFCSQLEDVFDGDVTELA